MVLKALLTDAGGCQGCCGCVAARAAAAEAVAARAVVAVETVGFQGNHLDNILTHNFNS